MKKLIILFTIFILIFISGYSNATRDTLNLNVDNFNSTSLSNALNDALKKSITNSDGIITRNAAICVDIPELTYKYFGADGIGRVDTGEKMTTGHQFFISSVGKIVTSTVIMQLYEEGYFGEKGLDATLEELDIFPLEILDILHIKDGISYGRNITIRQLLNHATGLKDVDNDNENDTGDNYPQFGGYAPGSLNYQDVYDEKRGSKAALNFIYNGTPKEGKLEDYYLFQPLSDWDYESWKKDPLNKSAGQLNFFLAGTNKNALFKPGENMYYSDTNYLILGLIIEKITGKNLDEIKNERIFEPLGMKHTYLVGANTSSAEKRETRLSDYWGNNEPLISLGIDLSRTSKGDGGEISTLEDMNTFIRAFADGKLFKNKSTLTEMLKLPFGGNFEYAGGIVFANGSDGIILIDTGSSGAWIEYYSKYNLSIVGSVNEINPERMMKLRTLIFSTLEENGIKSSTFKYGPETINFLFSMKNPFVISFGIVSILIFLSAIISWPLLILLKKIKLKTNFQKTFVLLAVINSVLNLVFIFILAIIFISNSDQILLIGYIPLLEKLFVLPLFSILLASMMIVSTILLWRNKYWEFGKRIYYTFITLASISFLLFLQSVGLLFISF